MATLKVMLNVEMKRVDLRKVRCKMRVRENLKLGWRRVYMMSLSKRVNFPLTHTRQVVLNHPEMDHPLHFFRLLITDEMLDGVVAQTHLYASYCCTHDRSLLMRTTVVVSIVQQR